jgi:fucose permease
MTFFGLDPMDKHRLFVASCLSIGTASVVFAIRGDIAGPLSQSFQITNEQMGLVFSPAFWAFTMAIFISGNLVDVVGMRRLHILSALGFITGVTLIILAPHPDRPVASLFDHIGTTFLYIGFFMFGLSHGLVEGVINPLMASLYTDEKTRRITAVHAWWPAGLIIGGLLAIALSSLGVAWQLKLCLILLPAIVYLVMALSLQYPKTERAMSNVSTRDMWKQAVRPLFLLLFACMWMTAATEMGPDQWFPRVMGELVPQLSPEAGSGVLFLVYTGGLMFVLRMWGSAVTHKSPILTMVVSSLLSAIGLYWLGALDKSSSAIVALTAATIFGIGKTFLWPTMLGITAEQFPRGGALLLSLMGGAGMLSVAVVLPIMGARIDRLGPGAALQMVAGLGAMLTIIFAGLWLYFRAKGGYRAVSISEPADTRSPLANIPVGAGL